MTPHKLKIFAHHQAAHAVAHYHFKIGFKSVTLENSEPHFVSRRKRGAYTEAHAIACYAGEPAERKSGHRGQMTGNSVCDYESCREQFDEWMDEDFESAMIQGQLARRRAEALVDRHWDDIKAVAQLLQERKRLSHAEVAQTIARTQAK